MTDFLTTGATRRIAYHLTSGSGPCVVFLGGYKSDMTGTKAVHLETWARAQGRAFLRLDYSGHGASSGEFADGCIGDWVADAQAVIEAVTEGPLVLVGSSMGGWIALILAQRLARVKSQAHVKSLAHVKGQAHVKGLAHVKSLARVTGLVGIAAAPDFTEDSFWAGFDAVQRAQLMETGVVPVPSEYGDDYIVTRRLIEDGRDHLVLRDPLQLPFPVRLLQGTQDSAVTRETALRLLDHIEGEAALTLLKGADHAFSAPECLSLIERAIEDVTRAP